MKQRLFYWLFRAGMAVVGVLPYWLARRLGEAAGLVFGWGAEGRRSMVERHGRRLGFEGRELRGFVHGVFAGYGRYWSEALWVRPRRRRRIESHTRSEGLDLVREAASEGKGMIFALPHMGNWEFAGPVAKSLDLELWAVAEDLGNPLIRDWFVALRNQLDIGIVIATRGGAVIRQLEQILERGGAVALLCDRDLKRRGVEVEFFGERTTLPAGPVSLALRTGAPLFPVAAYFTGDGGHRVVVRPRLALAREGDRAELLGAGTQQLAKALEELVMDAPEQWHLLQPNWPSDFDAIA